MSKSEYEDAYVKKIQIFLDHPEQGFHQLSKEFSITDVKTNLDPKNLINLMQGSFFKDLTKSKGMILIESFIWFNSWEQHLNHIEEPEEYDEEDPDVDYMFYDFTGSSVELSEREKTIQEQKEYIELLENQFNYFNSRCVDKAPEDLTAQDLIETIQDQVKKIDELENFKEENSQISCAYCGALCARDVDELIKHVEGCEKHPVFRLINEKVKLQAQNEKYRKALEEIEAFKILSTQDMSLPMEIAREVFKDEEVNL